MRLMRTENISLGWIGNRPVLWGTAGNYRHVGGDLHTPWFSADPLKLRHVPVVPKPKHATIKKYLYVPPMEGKFIYNRGGVRGGSHARKIS